MDWPEVAAHITPGRNATIAHVSITYEDSHGHQWVNTVGEAICHPDDKPNKDVGGELALGRALEAAGRRLVRRANGKVKHADQMRAKDKKEQDGKEELNPEFPSSTDALQRDARRFAQRRPQ